MPIPGGPRPAQVTARRLDQVAARVGAPTLPPGATVTVTGVTLSSATVHPGDLYAALRGARAHGADFAGQAAAAGARAVLTDSDGVARAEAAGLPVVVVPDPRAVLGDLAAWLYGEPATRMTTFGVTGTNGKTTTTFLLDAALRAAGRRTGLVGTVETRIGDRRWSSARTTPEAPDLHALLAVMVEDGVTDCALEISSHALTLHRVDGLVVDVAGFTNLSRDHLDFHAGMEDYFAAKAALFTPARSRRGVVCIDDDWGRRLAAAATVPVVTVATRPGQDADWRVDRLRLEAGLPVAAVTGPGGVALELRCPLPGDFNVANCLLALAMLVEAGLDGVAAAGALAEADAVPGRMERVAPVGGTGGTGGTGGAGGTGGTGGARRPGPLGIVDYAHTPDAVGAALAALRGTGRPLVVVLGAGGDRDREKRPLMGAAAARGADVVVVTDDNPRSEDPAVIRAAVLAGARQQAASTGAVVLEVADRAAAIAAGVARAGAGGVLLVAGKGHEHGQEVAGTVHPFDDRSVLAAALVTAAGQAPLAPSNPAPSDPAPSNPEPPNPAPSKESVP